MNPWIVTLLALAVGALLGAVGAIAIRRGRGEGAGENVPLAPAQEAVAAAEDEATRAREDHARAEREATRGRDETAADWINRWVADADAATRDGKGG